MSKKAIVTDESKLLEFCEQVEPTSDHAKETVVDLTNKLKTRKDCLVLAAPQIGISERVICVKYSNGEIVPYINPQLLYDKDFHLCRETDVCFGKQQFLNLRPDRERIVYYDLKGEKHETIFKETLAELFNRAMSYLNGITPKAFGLELDDDYDKLSDEEKAKVHDLYVSTIKEAADLAMKEAEADPESKKTLDAIEFMKSVQRGDTKLDVKSIVKDEFEMAESLNKAKEEAANPAA